MYSGKLSVLNKVQRTLFIVPVFFLPASCLFHNKYHSFMEVVHFLYTFLWCHVLVPEKSTCVVCVRQISVIASVLKVLLYFLFLRYQHTRGERFARGLIFFVRAGYHMVTEPFGGAMPRFLKAVWMIERLDAFRFSINLKRPLIYIYIYMYICIYSRLELG